jgi:phosphoglycerate dehydrogenase-like enzyme
MQAGGRGENAVKLAILDDYQGVALAMADWRPLAGRAAIEVFRHPFDGIDAAAAALADFDILCIMRERVRFPREMFARLPKLKCLVTTGGGNAAIDLAAARDHGVVVCGTTNGPGQRATAELTWGLILAASRHLVAEDGAVRAGRWQTTVGALLYGKTIGIVGLGAVGGQVARFAGAFGMRVLAWSATLTTDRAAEFGARRVEKDLLLGDSDIVSVHVTLNDRTRGLIGAREFALMKPATLFVNTARGPVIDEAALIAALAENRIAGAALDVFDREPLPADHALRGFGAKVILSPHIGYVTEEVYRVFYRDTAEAALAFIAGKPIRVLNAG